MILIGMNLNHGHFLWVLWLLVIFIHNHMLEVLHCIRLIHLVCVDLHCKTFAILIAERNSQKVSCIRADTENLLGNLLVSLQMMQPRKVLRIVPAMANLVVHWIGLADRNSASYCIVFEDNSFICKQDDLGIRFHTESIAYQFLERKVLPNYIRDNAWLV